MSAINLKSNHPNQQITVNINTAIDSACDAIGYLQKTITSTVASIASSNHQNGIKELENIYSVLDLLLNLFQQIVTAKEDVFKSNKNLQQNLTQIEIHLLGLMKALLQAKEKKDYVMVSDLLEYELADNLTQWRIKILLEISKLQIEK